MELIKVPQCVADWCEDNKDLYICNLDLDFRGYPQVIDWIGYDRLSEEEVMKNEKTLMLAFICGCLTEEEKYIIKDTRLSKGDDCLIYRVSDGAWFFGDLRLYKKDTHFRVAHTDKQLLENGWNRQSHWFNVEVANED